LCSPPRAGLPEDESKLLYETHHVAGSGRPLFSAATANLNPWTEDQVDTKNPNRGPLLLISGEKDNTAPWAIVSASYDRQKRKTGSDPCDPAFLAVHRCSCS
jgi:hypothetical protein